MKEQLGRKENLRGGDEKRIAQGLGNSYCKGTEMGDLDGLGDPSLLALKNLTQLLFFLLSFLLRDDFSSSFQL